LCFEGPGCSSVGAGAFVEHGPFKPTKNGLIKNDYSWNKGNRTTTQFCCIFGWNFDNPFVLNYSKLLSVSYLL